MRQGAVKSKANAAGPALPARTMGEFVALAQTIATLPDLTAAFAATIAGHGYDGHVCITPLSGVTLIPLFGDMADLSVHTVGALGAEPQQPQAIREEMGHRLVVPVESWHDQPLYLVLRGIGSIPARADAARLQGLCEVYATYGYPLFEQQQDVATNSGLGLVQRRCLALILTGHKDYEIADVLELTPFSVRAHIEQAMILLHAGSRIEAVATAARRGWLVGLEGAHGETLKQIPQ